MMTRVARKVQQAVSPERREELLLAFGRHMDKLRELRGMGEGVFPPVPAQVSQVSRYTTEALDRIPFEVLEAKSLEAAEQGDWYVAEVLSVEIERREAYAMTDGGEGLEREERIRWQSMTHAERENALRSLDPVTSPAVRQAHQMSAAEVERAARIEYEAYVERQILDAEEATNGNLFNPRGRNAAVRGDAGITPRALWSNHVIADAYASEELRRYWAEPGRERLTFAAYMEMVAGRTGSAREGVAKSSLTAI